MINETITKLIRYGLSTGLIAAEDEIYVTNQVLEALGSSRSWETSRPRE